MADEDRKPLTTQERIAKLDKVLDEYEKQLGLPAFQDDLENTEVQRHIQMSQSQIEKLTPEDCAMAALILDSYSFHLQRALNRENARIGWAKHVLKDYISGKESQYTGSWESQYHQAIKGDDYAKDVFKIQGYAQRRADRITYLATAIKSTSDKFMNMQRAKGMK